MCADRSSQRSRQRGITIIELMVGMVVALIVGLAATSSAMMFNASQRQGMAVGGVAVNVTTAMAALKNDVSTAGLGFFGESRYLCDKLNFSVGATVYANGIAFSPLQITRPGGLDRIDVLQASRVQGGASVMLAQSSDGTSASLRSFLPVSIGDAVLLAPATAIDPCVVRSVTAITTATEDSPQVLAFGAAGSHNAAGFTTNPTYPSADGASGGVTALGTLRWQRYRLNGTDLLLEQPLTGASAVVARNVMGLRAQYGVAPVGGGKALESWVDATGDFATLDNTNIRRVRAIRVFVVTRSPQAEKPDDTGVCQATTTMPTIVGAEVITPDVANWRCFRYRTATLVIPMRNLVWGIP